MRYFRLFWIFLRTSLIADLSYRMNFLTRLAVDFIWYAVQILTFKILFLYSPKIGDWSEDQTYVFLGVLFMVDAIFMVFFATNVDGISDKIRKGDLDLLLVKPINSQFMMSLQRANTPILGNLFFAIVWTIWHCLNIPQLGWSQILYFLFILPCGLIVTYSMRFMMASAALFFVRAENFQYLYWQLYKFGMRPVGTFPTAIQIMLKTALPMALVASIPSQALFGELSLSGSVGAIVVSLSFLWASHRLWNYGLRSYIGASV